MKVTELSVFESLKVYCILIWSTASIVLEELRPDGFTNISVLVWRIKNNHLLGITCILAPSLIIFSGFPEILAKLSHSGVQMLPGEILQWYRRRCSKGVKLSDTNGPI